MLRKGAGFRTIGGLVLGLLTLSVVATSLASGGLGGAITEGFNLIQGNVDYTVDVENTEQASAKQVISDAAKFSYHRARNCNQVQDQNSNGGYPGLAHSYLGQTPACEGASDTWARPGQEITTGESGNDMEGRYSRVNFEVTASEPIILEESSGEVWLENDRIAGAAMGDIESKISDSCTSSDIEDGDAGAIMGSVAGGIGVYGGATAGATVGTAILPVGGTIVGGAVGGAIGGAIGWFSGQETLDADYIGTDDAFMFYYQADVDPVRATFLDSMPGDFSNSIYCNGFIEQFTEGGEEDVDLFTGASALNSASSQVESYAILCPGDKGYVQTNKGKPTNTGEADADVTGRQIRFPYIQITSRGSCGEEGIGYEGLAPATAMPGQDLRITGSADDYNEFDLQGGLLDGNMTSACDVQIGNPAGTVRFKKGAVIEEEGELPPLYSSDIYSENLNEENTEFYNNINFDGSSIGTRSNLLVSYFDGETENRLYGDLLCVNTLGQFNAQWNTCIEDEETTVRVNGYTYSCDAGSSSWESNYNPKSDITEEYNSVFPRGNDQIIQSSYTGFEFNPQEADQQVYITWDGEIPEGTKTITMELEFEERGHLQIDAQKGPKRGTLTYINTHAQGEPPIWYFKDHEANSYGSTFSDGQYSETDMTYDTNEVYTIELSKGPGSVVWHIEGGGQELTKEMDTNKDFTRLVFETWTPSHYPDLEKPKVHVRDIELET